MDTEPLDRVIVMRCKVEEKRRWKDQAECQGMTLSEWVRKRLKESFVEKAIEEYLGLGDIQNKSIESGVSSTDIQNNFPKGENEVISGRSDIQNLGSDPITGEKLP